VTSDASPAGGENEPEVSPFPSTATGEVALGRLSRAADLLGPLIDQIPVGVVAVRPGGGELIVNDWMREIFQPFSVDESGERLQMDWSRVSLLDGRPAAPGSLPLERCIAEGHPIGPQEYVYHGSAGDRTISVDAVPVLAPDGTVLAYASTIVDETLTRRFVDQLGEIQRELDGHIRELNRVHGLIERLSSRSELPELLTETVAVVAELDGADMIAVFLEHDGRLGLAANHGMTPAQARLVAALDSRELYTSQRAMMGLPTTLVDVHREPGLGPAYREALERLGAVSVYSMPLMSADGAVLGSVVSIFQSVRLPSPHQRQLLDTCGRIVAQLIVNAQVRAKDRDVAVALQQSMMQQILPEVAWGELATVYRAGSTDMYVGGDWFHAARLTDGLLSLVIADVVGHGLEAVRTMGRMRSAVRAYTLPGPGRQPPGPLELAMLLDHWCAETDAGLASTACFVDIDPRDGRCRMASAGHPPPLLIGPGQPSRYAYEQALGPPLGLMAVGGEPAELELKLSPGTTIVLYTDGLIERRGEDLGAGLTRLAAIAERELADVPDRELTAACTRIVQACAPVSITADDVALLAFRYRP
jgi:serine phosphatase RsbU (regulator of sigma subunit)